MQHGWILFKNVNSSDMLIKPVRIQRSRRKGFKTPPGTVYVGRPTKYGNPFKLTPDGWIMCYSASRVRLNPWIYWSVCGGFTTADIIELYEQWVKGGLHGNCFFKYLPTPPDLTALKGKNLSCFCPLQSPCHADVLLKLANE